MMDKKLITASEISNSISQRFFNDKPISIGIYNSYTNYKMNKENLKTLNSWSRLLKKRKTLTENSNDSDYNLLRELRKISNRQTDVNAPVKINLYSNFSSLKITDIERKYNLDSNSISDYSSIKSDSTANAYSGFLGKLQDYKLSNKKLSSKLESNIKKLISESKGSKSTYTSLNVKNTLGSSEAVSTLDTFNRTTGGYIMKLKTNNFPSKLNLKSLNTTRSKNKDNICFSKRGESTKHFLNEIKLNKITYEEFKKRKNTASKSKLHNLSRNSEVNRKRINNNSKSNDKYSNQDISSIANQSKKSRKVFDTSLLFTRNANIQKTKITDLKLNPIDLTKLKNLISDDKKNNLKLRLKGFCDKTRGNVSPAKLAADLECHPIKTVPHKMNESIEIEEKKAFVTEQDQPTYRESETDVGFSFSERLPENHNQAVALNDLGSELPIKYVRPRLNLKKPKFFDK